MQKESINSRSEIILGKENIEYLSLKKIAVIGLGGVGSIIPLVLVRSNIRKIILIDNDFVNVSNLNRQIAYDQNDLGKPKVEALKEKLFNIRDDLEIEIYHKKIDANFDFNVLKDVNYVIDCIDDLEGKVLLTKYCYFHNIKIDIASADETVSAKVLTYDTINNKYLVKYIAYNANFPGIVILNLISYIIKLVFFFIKLTFSAHFSVNFHDN